ncbi:MAG: hypothetical protein ACTHMI_13375 [Mucilaginibacter sp.]
MDFTYEILPLEVKKHFQEPDDFKFLNIPQTDNGLQYGLAISSYNHKEPDYYTFEIIMDKTVETIKKEINFQLIAVGKFKIKLEKNIIPEAKLYFLFLETATKQFVNECVDRTRDTRHQFHRIPLPVFEDLKVQLQTYIDNWDKNIRHTALN